MTGLSAGGLEWSLLLASSIHDMKNSLALLMEAISSASESGAATSADQRDHFATMQSAAARINNDLLHLLTLYRLDQDQLQIRVEEVWLGEFLEEQVAQQALLFQMRGLQGTIDCPPDVMGFFDRSLVAGIINNGLLNAVRHARSRIWLRGCAHNGGVLLTISDDGEGLPPGWSLHASAARPVDFASGSTSLGLHFAREVAQLHRRGPAVGRLNLRNGETGGAELELFLP